MVGEGIVHLLTKACHVRLIGETETDCTDDGLEELSLKDHSKELWMLTFVGYAGPLAQFGSGN